MKNRLTLRSPENSPGNGKALETPEKAACSGLAQLRDEIRACDLQLRELIRKRTELARRVASRKEAVFAPERELAILAELADWTEAQGMDSVLMVRIWRQLMQLAYQQQGGVQVGWHETLPETPMQILRDWFGCLRPLPPYSTPEVWALLPTHDFETHPLPVNYGIFLALPLFQEAQLYLAAQNWPRLPTPENTTNTKNAENAEQNQAPAPLFFLRAQPGDPGDTGDPGDLTQTTLVTRSQKPEDPTRALGFLPPWARALGPGPRQLNPTPESPA